METDQQCQGKNCTVQAIIVCHSCSKQICVPCIDDHRNHDLQTITGYNQQRQSYATVSNIRDHPIYKQIASKTLRNKFLNMTKRKQHDQNDVALMHHLGLYQFITEFIENHPIEEAHQNSIDQN